MADKETPVFKVILMGDSKTGKTTYIRSLTKHFSFKYYPTIHTEITTIKQNTNKGHLQFNIWDSNGDTPHTALLDHYLMYSDAALIFFNVNRRNRYYNLARMDSEIIKCCNRIPTVFCANKIDFAKLYVQKQLPAKYIEPHDNNRYMQMSFLRSYNTKEPLKWIARKLLKEPDLEFSGDPVVVKPKMIIRKKDYVIELKEFVRVHTLKDN